jgi:hypothetical protein
MMPEIIFNDKNKKPDDSLLAEKIGRSFKYFEELRNHIGEKHGITTEEWKFYGQKYGWQLKTLSKKRNLFFFIPYESFFRIVFVFGNKAVKEIEKSDVSNDLKREVINAKKYAEGRGLSIEVKDDKYIADIKKLIAIKIDN